MPVYPFQNMFTDGASLTFSVGSIRSLDRYF